MGKTGVGTKREDCETLLDGVGLPATPLSRFYFIFVYVFFYPTKKKERKNWRCGVRETEKCTKWGMEGSNLDHLTSLGEFEFVLSEE